MDKFGELVNGKRVAVVGNAPTANAFEHADKIDGCDVVIRFNKFRIEEPYFNVGKKTDIVAMPCGFPAGGHAIDYIKMANPKLIYGVSRIRGEELLTKDNSNLANFYSTEKMDKDYFHDIDRQLGARQSTGFGVLYALLDKYEPAYIYLTGMSFTRLKKNHYYPGSRYAYKLHCPLKELQLFAQMYDPNVVEVDPHIYKRLHTGQRSNEFEQHNNRGGKPYSSPHRWVYRQLAERIANKSILEVGAGIGCGYEVFSANNRVIKCIEPDPDCCKFLKEAYPRIDLFEGSLEQFETTTKYDYISVIEVLEHLPPIAVHPFLCKLRTLGNSLCLSTPSRKKSRHGRFTETEIKLRFAAAGWEVTEILSNNWARLYIAK